ncbi:hypothetical protein ACN9MB_00100 [Dyella kyungheensis]|jgi:hypothetical protein|uniref:hypothetical protein n=1 Tax=Dyella kyungheensis TaxID=1242174 RepID=UPI003CF0B56B
MNAQAMLLAPWRATHVQLRWLSLAVLTLCALGAIALLLFAKRGEPAWMMVGAYDVGLIYLWAFFLSGMSLLAIEARWLCLPGMYRTAVLATVFYAVLSLLPTAIIAVVHGTDQMSMLLGSLLCVLGGLCFALLPRYVAVFLGMFPALFNMLSRVYNLPHIGDARFVSWGSTLAMALLVVCVLRWRAVTAKPAQGQMGFSGPMVLQYRRGHWAGGSAINGLDATTQVRQRPDWMQPQPDLRHVGPSQPDNTLRVALGGWYLPRTLRGHLQGLAPGLLAMLVPCSILFLTFLGNHAFSFHAWWPLAMLLIGWIAMFGSMGLMFTTIMLIQQRWKKNNAELPLLALLPGLGNAHTVKQRTLMVALRRPLVLQMGALIALIALILPSHPSAISMLLLVVGQFGCAAALIACVIAAIGGRPLAPSGMFSLMISISLLIGSNSFLTSSQPGSRLWTPPLAYSLVLLAGWIIVSMVIAWMGRRGWIAWKSRPHAFMPNG